MLYQISYIGFKISNIVYQISNIVYKISNIVYKISHILNKISGPGCSKLTTSLVNVSLKFQTLISQIC